MKPHIIAGSGGAHLLPTIQQVMGIPESNPVVSKKFSDGEIFVQITQNIRNGDVFIVQSTSSPTNDRVMELILLIDAARRGSAERITCVIPYFGYARQDRKEMSRVAISARAVANCLEAAGADRIIAVDLHAAPIQGFFNIPVDNLYGGPVIADSYTNNFRFDPTLLTVVSPDVGGVARARRMAEILNGAPLAIIDKRREQHNVAEVMHIIGDVKGRHCFMLDDMIDTAGTACEGRKALLDAGAASVTFAATHGVLSGPALDRIVDSGLDVIITDSIDQSRGPHRAWARGQIRRVSIAPLLAQAIMATHNGDSISSLFPSKAAAA
jgi:ribose-phosphate pyrophosphokinase